GEKKTLVKCKPKQEANKPIFSGKGQETLLITLECIGFPTIINRLEKPTSTTSQRTKMRLDTANWQQSHLRNLHQQRLQATTTPMTSPSYDNTNDISKLQRHQRCLQAMITPTTFPSYDETNNVSKQ
ncbi:28677_t:CDS:2, partial [Dentiscutata erythropus]